MNNRKFRYYSLLVILYSCVFCAAHMLTDRLVVVFGVTMSAGTFVMPLTYFFSDCITEVYGYEHGRQLIWFGTFGTFAFAICVTLVNLLPSPPSWQYLPAYEVVIHPIFRIVIASTAGILMGSFINIYALSKWKVLTKGKYFWLRSLGATAIGEAVFVIVGGLMIFTGVFPIKVIISIMIASYLTKILYGFIVVWPSAWLVAILKHTEKVNVFDYSTDFNPFKIRVNYPADKNSE